MSRLGDDEVRRLEAVWAQLEQRGAVVSRVSPELLTPLLARALAESEIYRLAILVEADAPGPAPYGEQGQRRLVDEVAQILLLVEKAVVERPGRLRSPLPALQGAA